MAVEVKGLDVVLKNLNKQIKSIEGDITKGLLLGMQKIKADSMRNTPVDTGNLKGSHYVIVSQGSGLVKGDYGSSFNTKDKSGARVSSEHAGHISESKSDIASSGRPTAEVGCTAFYAEAVHENLESSHLKSLYEGKLKGSKKKQKKFTGPVKMGNVGGAKFLEKAIKSNAGLLVSLIKRYAKR